MILKGNCSWTDDGYSDDVTFVARVTASSFVQGIIASREAKACCWCFCCLGVKYRRVRASPDQPERCLLIFSAFPAQGLPCTTKLQAYTVQIPSLEEFPFTFPWWETPSLELESHYSSSGVAGRCVGFDRCEIWQLLPSIPGLSANAAVTIGGISSSPHGWQYPLPVCFCFCF